MPKPRMYTNFCIGLSQSQHRQIEKIMSIEGSSKNQITRDAIDRYIEHYQSLDSEEQGSI